MWTISWTVKSSKLCDLRCRYCYEWDHLADPERISLGNWARLLTAIRRTHEMQEERFGEKGRTQILWHGGEPLLLPVPYLEEVLRLEKEIFGEGALRERAVVNFMQTNLVSLSDDKLDFLARERFELGVSLDVVEGPRVGAAGGDVRGRVISNLERVGARGLRVVGAVVLAAHTRARMSEVFAFFEHRRIPFKLFPLVASPPGTGAAAFGISDREVVDALTDLLEILLVHEDPVAVQPLETLLETALLHLAGLERQAYDRRRFGDRLLVVDTDGSLYTLAERYAPGHSLGNVFVDPIEEIFASPAYASSLDRDDALRDAHCGGCRFRGACDTYPLFAEPLPATGGRCRFARALLAGIEERVRGETGSGEGLRRDALALAGLGAGAARCPSTATSGL